MTNCPKCPSPKVSEAVEGRRLIYSCHECGHSFNMACDVDDMIKIINTSEGIKHIEAAAVIHIHGKILFVEQESYPNLLELPVSHLRKDESLEHALIRTICDIIGIEATAATLLGQFEQPVVSCRYGADSEEWAIFDVTIDENDLEASNPSRPICCVPTEEIDSQTLSDETTFALTALGYINKNKSPNRPHG